MSVSFWEIDSIERWFLKVGTPEMDRSFLRMIAIGLLFLLGKDEDDYYWMT